MHTPATTLSGKTGPRESMSSSTRESALRDATPASSSEHPDMSLLSTPFMAVPQDLSEDEFEDEGNFASPSQQHIDYEEPTVTCLSPPPQKRDFATLPQLNVPHTEAKPLPMLPEDATPSMVPLPLHILPQTVSLHERMNPKSHFSLDSVATGPASPVGSHFDSSSPSAYDSNDEYVVTDDGFDFGFSTTKPSALESIEKEKQSNGFHGYSLPLAETDSLHKSTRSHSLATISTVALDEAVMKAPFGSQVFQANSQVSTDTRSATALDELLAELGYLGDFISGD